MAKYPDLKSYLQANFIDLLTNEVQKFVDRNYDGSGFHSINVLSLLKHKIENLEVKALTCHDAPGPIVKMDVGVAADIVDLGIGRKSYEADRKRRWFTVYMQGLLRDGLQNIEILDVKEFHNGKFQKENALDQFLIPYIYSSDLEEIADDFTEFYCANAVYKGYALPVNHILQELEIGFFLADLPDDCLGRMYFKPAKEIVYHKIPQFNESWYGEQEIQAGMMLINKNRYYLGGEGTHLLTIAHEIIHWHLHQKYFKLLSLLDDESNMMSCEVEPSRYQESMTMAQKAHWFAEWQANALALRIAMPRELVVQAFHEAKTDALPYHFKGELIEDILSRIAAVFDVPKFAVKQRVRQLGFDNADGAFVYVDGKWYEPFCFTKGSLNLHQTFVIDRAGFDRVHKRSKDFAQLIDTGKFIYTGYVVCINDSKYVTVEREGDRTEFKLSDYARAHADECCLIFSYRSTTVFNEIQDKYEFYGESYLSKEVKSYDYTEHFFDNRYNDDLTKRANKIYEEAAKIKAAQDNERRIRREMAIKECYSFSQILIFHMDRKHITVEQLSERTKLSVTTIKKYRAEKVEPPIENAMALCIGLNLPESFSLDLLKSCGHHLRDIPRDNAYKVCLKHDDGTLDEWNMILAGFGQAPIPNTKNQ